MSELEQVAALRFGQRVARLESDGQSRAVVVIEELREPGLRSLLWGSRQEIERRGFVGESAGRQARELYARLCREAGLALSWARRLQLSIHGGLCQGEPELELVAGLVDGWQGFELRIAPVGGRLSFKLNPDHLLEPDSWELVRRVSPIALPNESGARALRLGMAAWLEQVAQRVEHGSNRLYREGDERRFPRLVVVEGGPRPAPIAAEAEADDYQPTPA